MDILTLLILAIGLSMDAFAVSVCKGLAIGKTTFGQKSIAGAWFGGFQALMPVVGYFLGVGFNDVISNYDHWIAFVLLALIGANMIREAFKKDDGCQACEDEKVAGRSLSATKMLPLAVATSIDALIVGVSFAFLDVNIWWAAAFIGFTTFWFSVAGVGIGTAFGTRYKSKAEIVGGVILILIGLKVLLEHLLK